MEPILAASIKPVIAYITPASVKTEIISIATSAAAKAGLALTVNTSNNTFTLTKNVDGSVLISGSADALTSYATASSSTSAPATGNQTLLYTGANYAVYAFAVLAIVAVAIVVKKRFNKYFFKMLQR